MCLTECDQQIWVHSADLDAFCDLDAVYKSEDVIQSGCDFTWINYSMDVIYECWGKHTYV